MSSRLLPESTEVRTIGWRSAGSPAGSPQSYAPPLAGAPPVVNGPPYAAKVQDRDYEAEIQGRVQAAFQRGLVEGEAAGTQRAAAQIAPVLKSFANITQELASARQRARTEAELSMVQLALAIARRVLRREISMDPEAILGLVRAGMDKVKAREIHRLRLSPSDAEFIRQNGSKLDLPPSVEIQADSSLGAGSAIFETSRGELDASALSQLDEIERGLADVMTRRR